VTASAAASSRGPRHGHGPRRCEALGSPIHRPAVAFGAGRASAPARRPAVAWGGRHPRTISATSGRLDGLLGGCHALLRGGIPGVPDTDSPYRACGSRAPLKETRLAIARRATGGCPAPVPRVPDVWPRRYAKSRAWPEQGPGTGDTLLLHASRNTCSIHHGCSVRSTDAPIGARDASQTPTSSRTRRHGNRSGGGRWFVWNDSEDRNPRPRGGRSCVASAECSWYR
jgi:hypothetical protein